MCNSILSNCVREMQDVYCVTCSGQVHLFLIIVKVKMLVGASFPFYCVCMFPNAWLPPYLQPVDNTLVRNVSKEILWGSFDD